MEKINQLMNFLADRLQANEKNNKKDKESLIYDFLCDLEEKFCSIEDVYGIGDFVNFVSFQISKEKDEFQKDLFCGTLGGLVNSHFLLKELKSMLKFLSLAFYDFSIAELSKHNV